MTATRTDLSPAETDANPYDLDALAELCGLSRETIITHYHEHRITLEPLGGSFHADERTLLRLRMISALTQEHDPGAEVLHFITGLLDRLENAEREIRTLRERL